MSDFARIDPKELDRHIIGNYGEDEDDDALSAEDAAQEAYDLYFESANEINMDAQFAEFLKHLLTIHHQEFGTPEATLATLAERAAGDWFAERQG